MITIIEAAYTLPSINFWSSRINVVDNLRNRSLSMPRMIIFLDTKSAVADEVDSRTNEGADASAEDMSGLARGRI